jgi:hypothetical protein
MFVYRSSRLRGKCTCPSGSACYNRISCDLSHVATTGLPQHMYDSLFVWALTRPAVRRIGGLVFVKLDHIALHMLHKTITPIQTESISTSSKTGLHLHNRPHGCSDQPSSCDRQHIHVLHAANGMILLHMRSSRDRRSSYRTPA